MDTKIIMDTKVIQQILGRFPDHGNQINVIMVNQVGGGEIPIKGMTEAIEEFELLRFLERLPQPRLQNLIAKAIELSSDKFPTKQEAIKFLGISFTTFYKYREVEKLLKNNEVEEVK